MSLFFSQTLCHIFRNRSFYLTFFLNHIQTHTHSCLFLSVTHTHTHTFFTLSHAHTRPHTFTISLSQIVTLSFFLSLSLSHIPITLTHSLLLSPSLLSCILSLCLSLLSLTHKYTLSLYLSYSLALFLFFSVSFSLSHTHKHRFSQSFSLVSVSRYVLHLSVSSCWWRGKWLLNVFFSSMV